MRHLSLERIVNGAEVTCAMCGHPCRLEPRHLDPVRDEGHRALPYHDPVLQSDVTGPFSRAGEIAERSAETRRSRQTQHTFQPISRVA